MKIIKIIAIFFFDILDIFIHQKRIIKTIKKQKINITTYLDIGAHKGVYTDLFLKNFEIKKAYLFEPQKSVFKFIRNKYKKNNFVNTYNLCVSDNNKIKNFYINNHDLTSSLTKFNEKNNYLKIKSILFGGSIKKMIKKTYKIKTIKLSNFLNSKKINKIDLIKVDTEGHEYQVIKGLENKIKKINIILIEFHNDKIYEDYENKKIHKYLTSTGFKLVKKIKFPFTEWEDRIYKNINLY